MSCNCSILKTNVSHAGVFGITKLALSGTKDKAGETKVAGKLKKRILEQTAIFGISGAFYDKFLSLWIKDMDTGAYIGDIGLQRWSADMMKSAYQMIMLGGYDFIMGRN